MSRLRSASPATFVAVVLAVGIVEMVLLALWQHNGYWDVSDGVYALTAREVIHGTRLYHAVVGAQPPPVYLFGALLLALHDGLSALRTGLALCDLAVATLVAVAVARLTGERWLAILAGLAAPLLPISLHEHAQLTPETLAAPLVLLGALCCSRRERAALGGGALALAGACKFAFVLPALAIVLVAASRRRALAGFLGTAVVLAAAALAVFGGALWTETVRAQFEVGDASLHYAGGLLAQGLWNELPLILGAAVVVHAARQARQRRTQRAATATLPEELRDQPLLRTIAAAALAGLVLALTLFKHGSYINVFVVAEPPLLVLASVGVLLAWRSPRRRVRVAVGVVGALLALQSLSLLISPTDAVFARRPFAHSGLQAALAPAGVARVLAAARRCSPTTAYSGAPYFAFLADLRMPGGQPDQFMLRYASADAAFARRAAADQPRCPN
jgi:Glycosyltransferase family 87